MVSDGGRRDLACGQAICGWAGVRQRCNVGPPKSLWAKRPESLFVLTRPETAERVDYFVGFANLHRLLPSCGSL